MQNSDRIPLPADAVFERMNLSKSHAVAADVLAGVRLHDTQLQDFQPLTQSLEWELSALHWNQAGVFPFVENDVPFLINNSGFLSEHVAAVLFANCVETPPTGSINVLELGAGMGLFARYFLDAFRAICAQENRDFYDRLVCYVTDQSAQTVRQWQERQQFTGFAPARVILGTVNATNPRQFHAIDSNGDGSVTVTELSNLRCVICNYLLDVLPATVVRKGASGPEELRTRTHLLDDSGTLRQYTQMSVAEIRTLSESSDPVEKARLTALLSVLEFETQFFPLTEPSALITAALHDAVTDERVVINHGAFACVESCLALLDSHGMILINDYGPVQTKDVAGHAASQRFGPTSALGINFPLLERHFLAHGCVVATPEADHERGIHARMLMKTGHPATLDSFNNRFGPAGADFFEVPCEDAKKHLAAGRKSEALDAYRLALSRSPRSWQLSGEIAEFVGLQLQDLAAGRELIRSALEQNPWYSPWLWNVLGDILFLDKNVSGAHEAYVQAQKIHPTDVRTHLNLAYTHFEFGAYDQALQALTIALAAETRGLFRARLLEKQHQVLSAISGRWQGEQERLARRAERLLR